jgi:CubicO group peptidase (beta-lactamase class C family)
VLAIGGGLGYLYYKDPVVTTRLINAPFGGETGPLELVRGGPQIETPIAPEPLITEATRAQAVAFGATNGTHALIVYRDDGIELEHYYPGHGRDSTTPTASMHKSVLAILAGIAIEDGYIESVDDPAAKYLPEWANDGRSTITLKQMLRQTSGIEFATFGLNPLGGFFKLMLGADATAASLYLPLEVEPGTRFDYNSAIPQDFGLIIQRATGKRYAEYLSEALWQHLGVPDAQLVLDSEQKRMARTFCCLDATARAWLHIGLLHLNRGRIGDQQIVPAQWIEDISTPGVHNPNYGYFTWLGNQHDLYRYYNRKTETRVLHTEPYVAHDVTYFDGFGGQRVYIIPSRRLVIVRTGDITTDWDDAYLPNTIVRGLRE